MEIYPPKRGDCSSIYELYNLVSKENNIFMYYWEPRLYFLFNINNATSFDSYIPLYNTREHLSKIVEELKSQSPLYIIKDKYIECLMNPECEGYYIFSLIDRNKLLSEDIVDQYIQEHYTVEKDFGAYLLLKKRK